MRVARNVKIGKSFAGRCMRHIHSTPFSRILTKSFSQNETANRLKGLLEDKDAGSFTVKRIQSLYLISCLFNGQAIAFGIRNRKTKQNWNLCEKEGL